MGQSAIAYPVVISDIAAQAGPLSAARFRHVNVRHLAH